MHVIFRESVGLDDTNSPMDMKQDPADLVVLSFSDSDLGAFMAGWKRSQGMLPTLRLANLAGLKHPLSVDHYIENTLCHAKGILIRLIGGESYWPYGLSQVEEMARRHSIALGVLPADGVRDPRFEEISTIPASTLARLQWLCDSGGAIACEAALAQLALAAGLNAPAVIGKKSVPNHAFYDPTAGILDQLPQGMERPLVVVFYRSYITGADLSPIDMVIQKLRAKGHNAIGIFAPSLKLDESRKWLEHQLGAIAPRAIINATAFSAKSGTNNSSPLDIAGVPVFQLSLSTARKKDWASSPRGLSPQDLAMHVVLPEIDGRIFAGVASFKSVAPRDPQLQYNRFQHQGDDDQIDAILAKILHWLKLSDTNCVDRKLCVVLSTYPGKSYQMAHAVGCDALSSTQNLCASLAQKGYRTNEINNLDTRLKSEKITISFDDYALLRKRLPKELNQQLDDVWGSANQDPCASGDGLQLPACWNGNILITLQPERANRDFRVTDYHDLERTPCHAYVAFYLWLQQNGFDALIHMGAHGTLEWLPGKSVALSKACWPQALTGSMPIIYPFIVNDPGEAAQAKRRINALTIGHMPPPINDSQTPQALLSLEHLLDEYSTADGLDPARRDRLVDDIREAAKCAGIEKSLGIGDETAMGDAITAIDEFVCDIKESQYAHGLHIFGTGPCGDEELAGVETALEGQFVAAGPSGSPYRGREDVCPTGRNLYSIDPRSVPTKSAHEKGITLADELIRRHLQDHGDYPRNYIVDLWGSATMRTGAEEYAMALHLAGLAPIWDSKTQRVVKIDIIPLANLGRPRIGVSLRVSGLFRDVFPELIQLFNQAVSALIARLENGHEEAGDNPYLSDCGRVFSPAPQSYGISMAGADEIYSDEARCAAGEAWLRASEWIMDNKGQLRQDRGAIEDQLKRADGFVHVQDLSETDLLVASDFASHQAGPAAARHLLGAQPMPNYHIDHSKAGKPKARALNEEIARIVYARATNSQWLNSMTHHGFRGGAEIAATLDHMAQFAHMANAVSSQLFDQYFDATLGNEEIRNFLREANSEAYQAMCARFLALLDAGLWQTKRNSVIMEISGIDQ